MVASWWPYRLPSAASMSPRRGAREAAAHRHNARDTTPVSASRGPADNGEDGSPGTNMEGLGGPVDRLTLVDRRDHMSPAVAS